MITHRGTQIIETPRLILRKAKLEDAKAMYDNWASDPEVTKYLTWPPHSSVEVTEDILKSWIAGYEKDTYYQWMIVLKELGDQPIGSLCAECKDDRIGSFHIGYCIGKAWWHQGIMSESLQAVIDYLFDQVHARRVDSRHDPNNPHSGGVMQKCGMRLEGTARRADWNNQGICDACYYAILASDRQP